MSTVIGEKRGGSTINYDDDWRSNKQANERSPPH